MKITLPITALAAILGLALAGVPVSVQAQTPAAATTTAASTAAPAAAKKTKYSGILTAVDATANTVTIGNKTEAPKTLSITSATKIKKDGKIATLADFKVGDKVGGSFIVDASGKMAAVTLNTGAKPTTKTATTPAATPATH